ncbi:F-protein [Alphabaculovirus alterspexiguae]|uniref:F-protein n=1 Tax=Spodoptera exigua multiple nucleopolyhedrovirus TaxID=10454 RepID=A0A3G2JTU9_9ABAC|nr:F-protein [Spodoptera exigua multiple nucleopolyhedrovirus]AYN44967.1 F-protein [Spodoptera exigua multiple nucleopolyhedrovirus]
MLLFNNIFVSAFVLTFLDSTLVVESKLASDIIKVTSLPTTSGIYFQYVNKMQFVQDIWHFVIEMDHGSVFYRLNDINNKLLKMQSRIPKGKNIDCENIIFEINNMIDNIIPELARQHNMLDHKAPTTPSNVTLSNVELDSATPIHDKFGKIRIKRGLLNIVGRFDNYLFGVMDSDDAHELHMLANSTNNLNSQVKQLTDEMIKLSEFVEEEKTVREIEKTNMSCKYLALQFKLLCKQLDEISNLYNKLDRAVDNAKYNHLNSMVVSPERLLEEMRNVSVYLNGLTWPVPLTEKAMHDLIDNLINVNVFVTSQRKLLFIIEVPLVSNEVFDVFHSIPLPYCDNKQKCAIMLPDSKYLGVSVDRRNYIRFEDISACRQTRQQLLCFRPQIVYETSQAKLCDIRIFMKNDKNLNYTRDCDVRVGKFEDELFYATSDYNNWLYVLQNDVDLHFQCLSRPDGTNIRPMTLHSGVGIIHAIGNDNCKLTTKKSRLSIHELYNNLNTVIEIPLELSYNFTIALQDISDLQLADMKINNDLEHANLHELTARLYDLRKSMNDNKVYSGSDLVDDDNDLFKGISDWFASIGIQFHYVKIIVMWIILGLLTLGIVKIYRTCCQGACSTLCNFNCLRRSHTVVHHKDRDMYYQDTILKPKKHKINDLDTYSIEMERLN